MESSGHKCQVNGAILVTWVANAAAKLSYAAANCALNFNVDAVCSVGVTGLVSVMGELAATASLAAATCTGVPPQLTTTKISVLGDQTVRDGRRLLVGQGPIGVGVQCGVDVGMVVANLANMGISINSAVNTGHCGRGGPGGLDSHFNKVAGLGLVSSAVAPAATAERNGRASIFDSASTKYFEEAS